MRARAVEEMSRLSINVDSVDQTVLTMSGGQRQAVAIARGIADYLEGELGRTEP